MVTETSNEFFLETVQEAVETSGLRPSDITKLTEGHIALSQASTWLSKWKMDKAALLLILRLCDEKVEKGIGFERRGPKNNRFSEILRPGTLTVPADSMEAQVLDNMLAVGTDVFRKLPAPEFTPQEEQDMKDRMEVDLSAKVQASRDAVKQRKIDEVKDSIPGVKTASELPANQSVVTPRRAGPGYDKSVAGKYKVAPFAIRFSYEGFWWEVPLGTKKFSIGGKTFVVAELEEIV